MMMLMKLTMPPTMACKMLPMEATTDVRQLPTVRKAERMQDITPPILTGFVFFNFVMLM
jgi:hypothetical protein